MSYDSDSVPFDAHRGREDESVRVDRLVGDVGTIKGDVRTLKGDIGRVNAGVDQLRDSMVVLSRHAMLMENHATDIAEARKETHAIDLRLRILETDAPSWRETAKLVKSGMLAVGAAVGLALLGLVLVR